MDGSRCRKCGIDLTDENWWPNRQRQPLYRCNRCTADYKNAWRRSGGEPNRSRRNKVAYCNHPECSRILRSIVLERGEFACGICHDPIDGEWHMDHIIPVSRNGPHCYYNLQPSHPECNLLKGATILVE